MPTGPPWVWGVLTLVFVDEVLAVAAVSVWGAYAFGLAGAIGAPVVTIAAWWAFASPRATYGGPLVRAVVKIVVFGGASAGLWVAGHPTLAAALCASSVVVNAVAQLPAVREASPPTG